MSLCFCLLGIDIIRSRGLNTECTENQLSRSSFHSQTILSLHRISPACLHFRFSLLCLPYHRREIRRRRRPLRVSIIYSQRVRASIDANRLIFVIPLLVRIKRYFFPQKLIETLFYEAAFACLHDDHFDRHGKSRDLKVDYLLIIRWIFITNKTKLILTKHTGKGYNPSASMQFNGSNRERAENARAEQDDVHRGNKSAFDPTAYAYDIFRICKSTAPAIFFFWSMFHKASRMASHHSSLASNDPSRVVSKQRKNLHAKW